MTGSRLRVDETGFTLIEILVAMVVIAAGVFAVLGALGVGIDSGRLQRNVVTAELGLRSFAEHVKDAPYQACIEDPDGYAAGFNASAYPEEEVSFEVVDVGFWDWDGEPDTLPPPGEPLEFVSYEEQCLDDDGDHDPDRDRGLQRVVVRADAAIAGSEHVTLVVKREAP
jgi:prepilin-type N-terminal cleavage/methylation domain-containing protein